VEFLIVIIPLLTMWLGLIQLALVLGVQLLVKHAAYKAARAAIVVLSDDFKGADYGNVPLNKIDSGKPGLETYKKALDNSKGRYNVIRNAARMVLAPVSVSVANMTASSVKEAFGTGSVVDIASGALATDWQVVLTFLDEKGKYCSSFSSRGVVTAQITFFYRCAVPIGAQLMCKDYFGMSEKVKELASVNGSFWLPASSIAGMKLLPLTAECSLPNQGK
jgi:Flp pilus assembly protein TadG